MPLADCLYSLCNGRYYFVETCDIPQERLRSGYEKIDRPYLLKAWESPENKAKALELSTNSEVLVCSTELSTLKYKRERLNKGKLTFEYSERPLKRGFLNIFSKTNIVNQVLYHTLYYRKPFYKLCAGGYVANDEYAMRSFIGKCYKFGYFPKVDKIDIDEVIANKPSRMTILWCARFLAWKHPEMVVELAKRMRAEGFDILIKMIGSGPMFEKVEKSLKKHGIEESVHLMGNLPNAEVLKMMRESHLFLLTSDKREGWGAVVNEAMSNGCCVVVSDSVGSAPFLIKNKENGCLFKSEDNQSLYENVKKMVSTPGDRNRMTKEAYKTISDEWSPKKAAENLYNLCLCLLHKREISIYEGPCTLTYPYPTNRK